MEQQLWQDWSWTKASFRYADFARYTVQLHGTYEPQLCSVLQVAREVATLAKELIRGIMWGNIGNIASIEFGGKVVMKR
jgi:hypothetical protein